jgi:hypothetical protein
MLIYLQTGRARSNLDRQTRNEMKRDDHPLKKVTINLFDGDLEKIQHMFPRPGASKIIRDLVHKFIADYEARAEQRFTPVPEINDADLI